MEKEKVAKSAGLQGKVDELEGKHKEAEEKLKASLQKSTTGAALHPSCPIAPHVCADISSSPPLDIDNLKKNFAKLRAKFEQAQVD